MAGFLLSLDPGKSGRNYIIQNRQPAKGFDYLKCTTDPELANLIGFKTRDLIILKKDSAAGYRIVTTDQIKNGCFAGAIGTNQAEYLALVYMKTNVVNCGQPSNVFY
jgi:hypothetical protein